MGWEHYRELIPPPPEKKKEREPQVGRGLFGVHLLILHFEFHQIFNISQFPQFNLSFNPLSPEGSPFDEYLILRPHCLGPSFQISFRKKLILILQESCSLDQLSAFQNACDSIFRSI